MHSKFITRLTWNFSVHLLVILHHLLNNLCKQQAAPSNRIFHANFLEEQPTDTRIIDINKQLQLGSSAPINYSQFAIVASNPVVSRFMYIHHQTGVLLSSKKIDRDMLCNMFKFCCSNSDPEHRTDAGSPIFPKFRRTADVCQFVFRVIFKASSTKSSVLFGSLSKSEETGPNATHSGSDYLNIIDRTDYCTVVVNIIDINDNVPRFVLAREADTHLYQTAVSGSLRSLSLEPVTSVELSVSELAGVGTCFKLPVAIDEDSSPYSIQEYRMDKILPSDFIAFERKNNNQTTPKYFLESEPIFGLVQHTCDHLIWTNQVYTIGQADAMHHSTGKLTHSEGWGPNTKSVVQTNDLYLQLMNKLDRESREEYWLKILALDGPIDSTFALQAPIDSGRQSSVFRRHTGTLLIRIQVLDENDNDPQVPPEVEFQVLENARIGTVVGVISATDQDLGDFGHVHYRLEVDGRRSTDLPPFTINPTTGTITVSRPLDADRMSEESQGRHQFRVICADSAPTGQQRSALTKVTVRLVNVNDETPQIKVVDLQSRSNPPRPTVAENQPPGQLVAFVTASDADSGIHGVISCRVSNNKFQLEIINSGTSDPFQPSAFSEPASVSVMDSFLPAGIKAANEIEFQLVTRVSLDREQSAMEPVEIICTDQAMVATDVRTGRVSFNILILDENDNDPQFTTDKIRLRIMENSPVNQMIAVLNATDADQSAALSTGGKSWHGLTYLPTSHEYLSLEHGSGTRLTYALDPEGDKYFRLDAHTGALYSRVEFDRELTEHLNFNVTVFDGGHPPRNVTAQVHLIVIDENDNPPQFEQELYEIELLESVPIGQLVATVYATDPDSGLNAEVIYQMEDLLGIAQRYFKLDSRNGTLRLHTLLDREKQNGFTFRVFAFDRGVPKQSAFCTVNVRVVDVNDNAPQFVYPTQKNHTIYASAFTPPGIPLVKLTAVDPDEGDNAQLSFHLDGDPAHLRIFHLDDKTGELSLLAANDPLELVGTYQLHLRVSDAGTPSLSGHARISIVLTKNAHTFSKYAMHSKLSDRPLDGSLEETEQLSTGKSGSLNRSGAGEILTRMDSIDSRFDEHLNNYYQSQPMDGTTISEGANKWKVGPTHIASYFSSERALIIIICLIALSAVIAFLFLVAILIVRRKSVSTSSSTQSENTQVVPRIVNTCAQTPWFDSSKSSSTPSASFTSNKAWLIPSAEKTYSPTAQSTMDYVQRGLCSPLPSDFQDTLELGRGSEQGNNQLCNEIMVKTLDSHRLRPNRLEIGACQCTPCVLLSANDLSSRKNLHRTEDHLSYRCASADSAGSSPGGFMDVPLQRTYQTIDERERVKRRGIDQPFKKRTETHMLTPRVTFAETDPAYQDLQFATVRDPPGPLELPEIRSMSSIPSSTTAQTNSSQQASTRNV